MSEMEKMQADAVSRAREMYSRRSPSYSANGFPSGYNGNIKPNHSPVSDRNSHSVVNHEHEEIESTSPEEVTEEAAAAVEIQEEISSKNIHHGDFLDTILADKEKALIILLIALLNEEKASPSLMLALMYLII